MEVLLIAIAIVIGAIIVSRTLAHKTSDSRESSAIVLPIPGSGASGASSKNTLDYWNAIQKIQSKGQRELNQYQTEAENYEDYLYKLNEQIKIYYGLLIRIRTYPSNGVDSDLIRFISEVEDFLEKNITTGQHMINFANILAEYNANFEGVLPGVLMGIELFFGYTERYELSIQARNEIMQYANQLDAMIQYLSSQENAIAELEVDLKHQLQRRYGSEFNIL